jgi:O-methyltransferase
MRFTRKLYIRLIRPFLKSGLAKQRVRLLFFLPGYLPLLLLENTGLRSRLRLLGAFLRIDWTLEHAHRPSEVVAVCRALAASKSGVLLEAGCWNGGSTAKFSLVCSLLNRKLLVYDSFEGVEPMEEKDGYDFSGEYACSLEMVRANIQKYGDVTVCRFSKGWFAETLNHPPKDRIAVAYIDCDVVKGTQEALKGIVPALTPDGLVFTQDFAIPPVRTALLSSGTWQALELPKPEINRLSEQLASLRF